MHIPTIVATSLFASIAIASPVANPFQTFKRAGPAAGQVITRCSSPGVLALAFNDEPHQYTQKLVDTLDVAGTKGTFFVTGTLHGCIYNQKTALQNAYKGGHQIASHTWTHPNLSGKSASKITSDMQKVEVALVNIIGKKPTYMRPPNLATGGSVLNAGDSNLEAPQKSEQMFTQAGASGNGHIPLMHETYGTTVNTLVPWLINWAKTNNLKIVHVAECLGDTLEGAYADGTGSSATSC